MRRRAAIVMAHRRRGGGASLLRRSTSPLCRLRHVSCQSAALAAHAWEMLLKRATKNSGCVLPGVQLAGGSLSPPACCRPPGTRVLNTGST